MVNMDQILMNGTSLFHGWEWNLGTNNVQKVRGHEKMKLLDFLGVMSMFNNIS